MTDLGRGKRIEETNRRKPSDYDRKKLQERVAKFDGGGTALLSARANIKVKGGNPDQDAGIKIILHMRRIWLLMRLVSG
jgi:hypothetical protein